jgi:hypothetical protein
LTGNRTATIEVLYGGSFRALLGELSKAITAIKTNVVFSGDQSLSEVERLAVADPHNTSGRSIS